MLDVGCGTGNVTRFLEYEAMNYLALDVVGVDCSKNMIEEARRLTPGEAKYEVGNAGKLRFADASFDVRDDVLHAQKFLRRAGDVEGDVPRVQAERDAVDFRCVSADGNFRGGVAVVVALRTAARRRVDDGRKEGVRVPGHFDRAREDAQRESQTSSRRSAPKRWRSRRCSRSAPPRPSSRESPFDGSSKYIHNQCTEYVVMML